MKIRTMKLSSCGALAACVLAGCASTPPADAGKDATAVAVYTSTELAGKPYDIIGHVWVDSWRTAFRLPTYPTPEEAVSSMKIEAARLGADGLVNVVCLDQGRREWFSIQIEKQEPAFLCYGGAIRMRRSAG